MTKLVLDNVSLVAGSAQILSSISLTIQENEFVVILGANGAGKTSLLRCAAGLETGSAGDVSLDDQGIQTLSPIERARKIAYLPQRRPMAWPIDVFDVVSLGRYAYGAHPGRLSDTDRNVIETAMASCRIEHLRNRRIDTLSGGETARVHCARAFAAGTNLLLADEPTTSLDPRHQLGIMQLIRDHVDDGAGALVVAHEASLAARFADRLIWMREGEIVADGSVNETMNVSMMAEIYGVSAHIEQVAGHTNVSVIDVL